MIAVTGGTGFVGARVLALAHGPLRALTRAAQAGSMQPGSMQNGLIWVSGDLAGHAALDRLCAGAQAVIHIAGVVNAADRAGFETGNVRGTANVVAAARRAGVRRFVHVSSLSAREPALSHYGASKAAADAEVQASGLDWVIVRPPAVYGPGDREMLGVFKAARLGLGVAPGGRAGRISVIHVDDLARALLALAAAGTVPRGVLELDDGAGDGGGYSHAEFATHIGAALGRRPFTLPVPGLALGGAARLATLFARMQGRLPTLSADRARYLAHPDWVARGGNVRIADIWTPQMGLAQGLADTVSGYRARGWL